ncbi:hypothetical protein BJ912DRAFT_1060481 [Pholiota molesta]|nr:hypothetical protein BJ912DRAFT_1060481 [Pholiota molesta]
MQTLPEQHIQLRQRQILSQLQQLQLQIPANASADTTHPWLSSVRIPVPVNAGNIVPPWTALKFNPVGLYGLRRWQGVYPLRDNFFIANQSRFRASDIAWFAAGTHKDGQHHHSINSFHSSHIELTSETGSPLAKAERKAMFAEMEVLIWDLLTALDRLSGSTSLLMRCQGTVVPGAGPEPQYIKNHVYFPPALLTHEPGLGVWLRTVCQQFVEEVGVRTVDNWFTRARTAFGWSLHHHVVARENPVLALPTTFPAPEPQTSHFIYPGQRRTPAPPAPVLPIPALPTPGPSIPSLSQSSVDSYPADDLDANELEMVNLHERLAFALLENRRLNARIAVLEAGSGILINVLNGPPTTPTRNTAGPSSQHIVTPSKASPRSFSPASPHALRASSPHLHTGISPRSPHVTIRTPRQNATTPSRSRFNSPSYISGDEFQGGSSRESIGFVLQGSNHGDGADLPDVQLGESLLHLYLRSHGLQSKAEAVDVLARLLPANCGERVLHDQLEDIEIPQQHIKIIASIIATNNAAARASKEYEL